MQQGVIGCWDGCWGTPQYSSFGKGGAGAGLQPLEGSYLRSLVAAPGSETTLVSCPPLVPSLCFAVDPHQVTPWLFLFALDTAAFPQQQPVNVFFGSKGG